MRTPASQGGHKSDDRIVTASVVLDELMQALGQRRHGLAQVSDAAVLTVAVVAAQEFAHNHERAVGVMHGRRQLARPRSAARCTRRLQALGAWLRRIRETLGALVARGEACLRDRRPVPGCRRARARRCRQVRGKDGCGSCAATRAQCCGWRRQLVCTTAGVPGACARLPGGWHDLTPIQELTSALPEAAAVDAEKADNAGDDEATSLADPGVRLVPLRKATMRPNRWADKLALRAYRQRLETRYSQLTARGRQHLHARTNAGLELTLHASLLAVTIANAD